MGTGKEGVKGDVDCRGKRDDIGDEEGGSVLLRRPMVGKGQFGQNYLFKYASWEGGMTYINQQSSQLTSFDSDDEQRCRQRCINGRGKLQLISFSL